MEFREMSRDEIPLLREIDRSEVIERVWHFRDGQLVLEDEHHDVTYDYWVRHAEKNIMPFLREVCDRGGTLFGAFDGPKIVGMGALGTQFIGKDKDQLNVPIMFVSRDYRKQGIATRIMELIKAKAREMGAKKLYVSATPSENTVSFYRSVGCRVTDDVDEEMFEAEPEDIHMELEL